MPYSIHVRANTKAEVTTKLNAAFDQLIKDEPAHSADRAVAQGSAAQALRLMTETPEKGISLAVKGELWKEGDVVKHMTVTVKVSEAELHKTL